MARLLFLRLPLKVSICPRSSLPTCSTMYACQTCCLHLGTSQILEAAAATDTVKTFVLTSSMSAMSPKPGWQNSPSHEHVVHVHTMYAFVRCTHERWCQCTHTFANPLLTYTQEPKLKSEIHWSDADAQKASGNWFVDMADAIATLTREQWARIATPRAGTGLPRRFRRRCASNSWPRCPSTSASDLPPSVPPRFAWEAASHCRLVVSLETCLSRRLRAGDWANAPTQN